MAKRERNTCQGKIPLPKLYIYIKYIGVNVYTVGCCCVVVCACVCGVIKLGKVYYKMSCTYVA